MIAHPIPASEDDEETLVHTLLSLQDDVDSYFDIIARIFEEHDKDLKPRAALMHASLQTQFQQLIAIPSSTFKNKETQNTDDEIMRLLNRLAVMWSRDMDQLTYGAMSWRRTAHRLVEELAERVKDSRVRFPLHRRLVRQFVTPSTTENFVMTAMYTVAVVASSIALVVLPSLTPPPIVGIPIGVFLAVLLLGTSLLHGYLLETCAVALNKCYKAARNADYALLHCEKSDGSNSLIPITALVRSSDLQRKSSILERSNNSLLTAGAHVFTLKYLNQRAYVNAKFIESQVLMIGIDTSFKVTYWNDAAETATGFLKGECIGQFLWDLADAPGGELRKVLEQAVGDRQQERGKQIIKFRLRSFATAPISLITIVAPVLDASTGSSDGSATTIGNLLICANAHDNLREARAYLNDYQSLLFHLACTELVSEGALSPEGREITNGLVHFLPSTFSDKLETLARSMVQEWEWTNATQLLGQSVAKFLGKCTTSIDTSFPNTICVSTFVPGIIEQVVMSAPKRCEVELSVRSSPPCQASFLVVEITVPPSSRPFNGHDLLAAIRKGVETLGGMVKMLDGDMGVLLNFPCQITNLQDTQGPAMQGDGASGISTSVNVLTVVTNMVEEHNISMTLLRARYVSVTNARDVEDVSNRLGNKPCDVDVIIADKIMLPTVRQLIEEHGLVDTVNLVPLLQGAVAPQPPTGRSTPKSSVDGSRQSSCTHVEDVEGSIGEHPTAPPLSVPTDDQPQLSSSALSNFVLYTPIEYFALERLIKAVAEAVAARKRLMLEAAERERILASRQDSPWTRGKLLGRGSFGEVYEAISDLTGGKMAVKMFFTRNNHEAEADALLNEVRIMCSLNHPNIVHYFHCEQKDRSINLFMELCDCSLGDMMYNLKKVGSCKLKINEILKQVISAVAYLHGMGIAHRDLKPQNILIKDDAVKLTDFGTAKQNSRNEVMSDTQGTYRYMAPEVFKGEPHKLSCDVWSIGCIACDMCSVTPDFMGAGNLDMLGELTTVTLPPMPRLAHDFVSQCLRVQQDLRPAASMLLLHPFLANSAENDLLTERFFLGKQNTNLGRNAFSLSSSSSSVRN